ncbi:MAG: ParB/RepB/Spo0J family partition protein [Gammaproteobacteria bacterium]|nr:ParB/RepB/Spo0J family partition protein [Gammaproteobacteria bacterium]
MPASKKKTARKKTTARRRPRPGKKAVRKKAAPKKKTTSQKAAARKKAGAKKTPAKKPAGRGAGEYRELRLIAVGSIERDAVQPRRTFPPGPLHELADDIRARGIQQPLTVRAKDGTAGRFIIIHGERRWLAAKIAGLKQIPCIITTAGDGIELFLSQIAENVQREDLNPMDRAEALRRLRDDFGVNTNKIPEFLERHGLGSFARSTISNMIRLTELPEWACDLGCRRPMTAA